MSGTGLPPTTASAGNAGYAKFGLAWEGEE
jgi:hypothetical protein